MADFLATKAGNPGRGGHALARAAAEVVEGARRRLASLCGSECCERVVLTHGCTDAVSLAINGIFRGPICQCGAKPHAVASAVEHNAVLRSLHAYQSLGILDLTIVHCGSDGLIDPHDFLDACTDRTVLACLSHASNVLGTIEPVEAVGGGLRERSPRALFLVDAAQTAGHMPLAVCDWNVDLLAIAGHKGLGGPTGTGALYVGCRAFPDELEAPHLFCERRGGTGAVAPGLEMPAVLPDALEAGTMNAVGFAGLAAAIDALPAVDHARERDNIHRVLTGLLAIENITVYGLHTIAGRTGSIAFNIADIPARQVAAELDAHDHIAVRGGVHCAPMLHNIIGTGERGAVRASPSAHTTPDEIDTFLEATARIATVGV
jgi:selenocysteine lyase/cysteine desulfurase